MASLGFEKSIKKWRVRWRCQRKGKLFQGSKTFLEKGQAIRFYAEMCEQEKLFKSGRDQVADSLKESVEEYKRHCRRFTARTQEHYQRVMDRFIATLPAGISFAQVQPSHIRAYLYGLQREKLSDRTLNAHLTVIKSFCRFVSKNADLPNPASAVSMHTETPPNVRILQPIEYEKILAVCTPLARKRIVFLANTGLRATEFVNLRWDNLSPDWKSLTIVGKGRKKRIVPLNDACREVLKQGGQSDYIFPSNKGGQLGRKALVLMFHSLADKAKIPAFGPHALRHYFATQLLLKGVSIELVSKILGHASIGITQRAYIHILPENLSGLTDVLTS